jgi:acetolactate decarboxylase
MPTLACQISQSIQTTLEKRMKETGELVFHFCFHSAVESPRRSPAHAIPGSATGALVEVIYEKTVSSKVLLNYGDFKLGMFVNPDGEMIVLDGEVYHVCSDGKVLHILDDVCLLPLLFGLHPIPTRRSIVRRIRRGSRESVIGTAIQTIFYAIRIDGQFAYAHTHAMRATFDGLPLTKAAKTKLEFENPLPV